MIFTVWEVKIGDEWKYVESGLAAISATMGKPGCLHLVSREAPQFIRRQNRDRRWLVPRGATPRRVAAAKRRHQVEQSKVPLFAEQLAVEQTPEARIQSFDDGTVEFEKEQRVGLARDWRIARLMLRECSEAERGLVLFRWSVSFCPPHPCHLIRIIQRTREEGIAEFMVEVPTA